MGNKLFGTDGVRGVANVYPMTVDFAIALAKSAAQIICTQKSRVAIAKDTRISGYMLEAALVAGFNSQGVSVINLGVLPTPALTMLTPDLNVDMAVMITASHNPFHDNGIKLISASGDKFSDQVTAQLEEAVAKNDFTYNKDKIGILINHNNASGKYKKAVLALAGAGKPLVGLKIVLDCANGVFSEIMPEVFKDLGAGVVALSASPDGYNINKNCGSVHPEMMMQEVVVNKAALGIAVDGDGDRIIVCDELGKKISSEQIIAFLAKYFHEKDLLKGRAVVSTILSNTGLDSYIKSLGVEYYSTAVGERYVIEKMQEVGGALGGEESGHVVLGDYSKTGDALVVGVVLALGLVDAKAKMSEIFPIFVEEPVVFVNPHFEKQEQIKAIMQNEKVLAMIEETKKQIEGQGRVVLRASGTEPLIRVWVGGKNETLVKEISNKLLKVIEEVK